MSEVDPIKASAKSAERSSHAELMQMYSHPGGSLIGRLEREARARGHTLATMARELGVTYGYIYQLANGQRNVRRLKPRFVQACARYLGQPAVMIKLYAGMIEMADFLWPNQTPDEVYNRALQRMRADPSVSYLVPDDFREQSLQVKQALVGMYIECSSVDVLATRQLPLCVEYLQRAGINHDELEGEACRSSLPNPRGMQDEPAMPF